MNTANHSKIGVKASRSIEGRRHSTLAVGIVASFSLVFACVFLAAAPTRGDDAKFPSPATASLLDEQTVGIVRMDTTRIDLDAVSAQVAHVVALSDREQRNLAFQKGRLAEWLEQFHRAGGRELSIVVSLADYAPLSLFVVVPVDKGSDRTALTQLFVRKADSDSGGFNFFFPFPADGAIERDGALVFGNAQQLNRLQRFHGPQRPIPKEASESVADAEIQVFVLPTDDQRRVLTEFLREPAAERSIVRSMPPSAVATEFLRDPGEMARVALTDGVQWITLGIKTKGPSAELCIGSRDAASARALNVWIAGAWQVAKKSLAAENGSASGETSAFAEKIDRLARLLSPRVEGNRLTVRLFDAKDPLASVLGELLGHALNRGRRSADSQIMTNQLKQVVLAMHNYHDNYAQFPPAAIRDAQGRPLLSWRVSLLPYLDANELYRQFRLDEPWDSEHNKKLIAKMPRVFAPLSAELREQGKTTFLVPIGKQTPFGPKAGTRIQDITDGTSNTLLIVDADDKQAVIWSKPEDLPVDGIDAKRALFGTRKDGLLCATADGAVHFLGPEFDEATLRALLTLNGKEPVNWPQPR